jgi:hypothetical protein
MKRRKLFHKDSKIREQERRDEKRWNKRKRRE